MVASLSSIVRFTAVYTERAAMSRTRAQCRTHIAQCGRGEECEERIQTCFHTTHRRSDRVRNLRIPGKQQVTMF